MLRERTKGGGSSQHRMLSVKIAGRGIRAASPGIFEQSPVAGAGRRRGEKGNPKVARQLLLAIGYEVVFSLNKRTRIPRVVGMWAKIG